MAHEGEPLDHRLPLQAEHLGDGARYQRPDAHHRNPISAPNSNVVAGAMAAA